MILRYFITFIIAVVSTAGFAQNSARYKGKNISVPKDSTVTIKIDSPKIIDANIMFCHVKNPDNSSKFDIELLRLTLRDFFRFSETLMLMLFDLFAIARCLVTMLLLCVDWTFAL